MNTINMKNRAGVPVVVLLALMIATLQGTEIYAAYLKDLRHLQWKPCPSLVGKGCEIALLHDTSAKRNLDIFFKVPGNSDIPDHWHVSAERMVLISGTLRVRYGNRMPELLQSGRYVCGPGRDPEKAFCEPGDPCVLYIDFKEPLYAFEVMNAARDAVGPLVPFTAQ